MATRRKSTQYQVISDREASPSVFTAKPPLHEREGMATKPEIPRLKIDGPESRKKGSTIPSSGTMQAEIARLESPRNQVRQRAAERLVGLTDDAEKARALMSLLPTVQSEAVEEVRGHCIGLLRAEMEKNPRPGAKRQ
ncbi:MAG: hypothetical protein AB1324_02000 [Candidatus Micrarchaeota archaeon]